MVDEVCECEVWIKPTTTGVSQGAHLKLKKEIDTRSGLVVGKDSSP